VQSANPVKARTGRIALCADVDVRLAVFLVLVGALAWRLFVWLLARVALADAIGSGSSIDPRDRPRQRPDWLDSFHCAPTVA